MIPSVPTTLASSGDRDGDGLRDAWEQRWGVTSPRDADTDDDGVPDSAEDADGDGLSNLGEQRYGTSPADADTDGDGTTDWHEDSDHDGRPDGREQDHRRLPAGLRPRLRAAFHDLPVAYRDGCHSGGHSRAIHPCVFGDPAGTVRITLYGDSHALQWLPALGRAARSRGWRITSLTKSACPSVHVRYRDAGPSADLGSCMVWRSKAERWIRNHPQDLVIVTNSKGYQVVDADGRVLGRTAARAAWQAGLGLTLDAIPADARVLVLGDVPSPGRSVPRCLEAHPTDMSRCERLLAASRGPGFDAAEQAAAEEHGARFQSPVGVVCPYDPCPAILGRTLVWRDRSHLTATISRQLAPTIRRYVEAALRD